MARDLIIERYLLPGAEEGAEVTVTLQFVNAQGSPIPGYRSDDNTGIIGSYSAVITDQPVTISLTPTEEIYPEGYWQFIAQYGLKKYKSNLIQLASAGGALTLPEFLELSEPGFWDVNENRLLPDPTGAADGAMASVLSGQWVVSDAPAGAGTVTSVAVSGSDGIEVDSGSPVTGAGTIALGVNAAALRSHLGIDATEWDGDIGDIDLDGGTDIGADLADADLILVDDGAAGTNRKSALSRVWTYIQTKIAALTDISSWSSVIDEDNMASNDATKVPTQQSVKAYVDTSVPTTPGDIGAATAAQGALADSATQPGDDADTLGSGAAIGGQVLTADGVGGAAWENPTGGSGAIQLSELSDVDASAASPSDGDILVYRNAGGDWVLEAKPASGSNPALNDVTDVSITAVADNEVLVYDSTSGDWINQTPAEAGLEAAGAAASAVSTHEATYNHDEFVVGPSGIPNNSVVRFDGTTGKLIQASGLEIADEDANVIQVTAAAPAADTVHFAANPGVNDTGFLFGKTTSTAHTEQGAYTAHFKGPTGGAYNHAAGFEAGESGAEIIHLYNVNAGHVLRFNTSDDEELVISGTDATSDAEQWHLELGTDPYQVFGGTAAQRVGANELTVVGSGEFTVGLTVGGVGVVLDDDTRLTETLPDGQTATSAAGTLTLACVEGAIASYQATLTEAVELALSNQPTAPAMARVVLYATASGADRDISLPTGWLARGNQIWPLALTTGSSVEIQISTDPGGNVWVSRAEGTAQ